MKKVFVLTLILTVILLLGCGIVADKPQSYVGKKNIDVTDERIKTVYGSAYERIFVDTKTNVMYLYEHIGYGGGMTVMLDADGKPLLWNEGDAE